MADRPNFFELLDLDPTMDDWTAIEKRIRERQDAWAKDRTMGSPGKRLKAKQAMDLLKEIREVMGDPVRRRQEAQAALARRQDARTAKERELAGWIELLQGAGSCGPEQLDKILRQFEGVFSEREVRERLQAAGVRVDTESADPRPTRERLDAVTAATLRRNLEQIGIGSLYELLRLPPSSSAAVLSARADEIYKENQRLGRTDAAATARNELAGIAKTLFRSEEEKRKYDSHRVLEVLDGLKEQLDAAGANGVLTTQQLDTLVRLAAQRGAPAEEARELLEEQAAEKGWRIERAPAPSPGPASTPSPGGESEEAGPPAPARLIVRPIPAGFRLSWEPVRPSGELRYRVLRKAGSVPWDEGDGEVVASTSAPQADDTAVPPGVSWYYAVFTLQAGLASGVPAHSGPHLLGAEAGAAGTAAPPSRLGGPPVRRMATAATVLLALAGTGAAFYKPALLSALSGLLTGASAAAQPQAGRQGSGAPGSSGSPAASGGAAAPGSGTAPSPSGPPATAPFTGTAGTAAQASSPGAVGRPPGAGSPPIQQDPNGGSSGASGSTGHGTGVLGDSAGTSSALPSSRRASSLPENPEVTVVAVGDSLLATAVESGLEQALRNEGLDIVSGLAALDDLRQDRGSSPSVSQILSSLRGEGVHAVVVARVEHLADRELNYYGRRDVASTSNLRIDAYLVDGGRRSLGPGWEEQIEYTAVNAASEGKSAASRAASDLAAAVRDAWAAHRGVSPSSN